MRVRILGAGIIGLACAHELLRRGHGVEVVDPAPASGASYAAAGMLGPAAEAWHDEDELLRLGLESLRRWPAFAGALGVAMSSTGTLLTGVDSGDLQLVERQCAVLAGHDLEVGLLDRAGIRRLEPTLGPAVSGGAWLPDDQSVDPREVLRALLARIEVAVRPQLRADVTVLATGARLPSPFGQLVRPVRGEILRASAADPPRHVVRGWVRGEPVYVVPRTGGEVVIGATTEEHEVEAGVTLGGVHRLLDAARQLLPGLDRAVLLEAAARDRPGTADNLPLIGPSGQPGVVLAAGHFRHGVLLAPLTAALVADHLEEGTLHPSLDPGRFAAAASERSSA